MDLYNDLAQSHLWVKCLKYGFRQIENAMWGFKKDWPSVPWENWTKCQIIDFQANFNYWWLTCLLLNVYKRISLDLTITRVSVDLNLCRHMMSLDHSELKPYSTTICKLVDLIPALHQSDCRIPNWVSAKTVLSCSTNHGQTTARFRSFFR